jgi:hypothetical protein
MLGEGGQRQQHLEDVERELWPAHRLNIDDLGEVSLWHSRLRSMSRSRSAPVNTGQRLGSISSVVAWNEYNLD